jgi:hypothetical protein
MKIYPSLNNGLTSQHLIVAEIIKTVSSERMVTTPPGKWNIHDNLAHLAKYQLIFIERVNKILEEDVPFFDRYKAEDDPDFATFRKHNDGDLLKCLDDQRRKLVALVSGLQVKDLERIGIHKKYGALNIIQWIEFFLLHEAHHIFTIFQLANDTDLK